MIPNKNKVVMIVPIFRIAREKSSPAVLTRKSLIGYFMPRKCRMPKLTYLISLLFIAEKTASENMTVPGVAMSSMREAVLTASP